MPVITTSESEMGKELAKWEQHQTSIISGTWTPGNPYRYREFPKMVYKAHRLTDGKVACMQAEPEPLAYPNAEQHDRACRSVDVFNRKCMLTVNDESELQKAHEGGWRDSPQEALEFHDRRDEQNLQAAAERAFSDSKMSAKAQREAAAAEAKHEGLDHLEEVPVAKVDRMAKARAAKARKAAERAQA